VDFYVWVGNYYSDHCGLQHHLIFLYYSQSPNKYILHQLQRKQEYNKFTLTLTDSADPEPEDTVEALLLVVVDTLTLLLILLVVK